MGSNIMSREFLDIFENWASDYDQSVAGLDPEYAAVFENYDQILNEVARLVVGKVMEFGVGTGNLSKKLREKGHQVIGIEPSKPMRDIAKKKFPQLELLDGDFLDFPEDNAPVDTIVSTYAFHHVKDEDKEEAIKKAKEVLTGNGKIIIGDTMFESVKMKQATIRQAEQRGYVNLAEDLRREYYPTLRVITSALENNDFDVTFKQMNHFVWIAIAEFKK